MVAVGVGVLLLVAVAAWALYRPSSGKSCMAVPAPARALVAGREGAGIRGLAAIEEDGTLFVGARTPAGFALWRVIGSRAAALNGPAASVSGLPFDAAAANVVSLDTVNEAFDCSGRAINAELEGRGG